jgi:hypothetical protein
MVRLHSLIRIPNELLRNHIRLCVRHRFLPSLVDQCRRPESWALSLRPRYQASSLPRAHPPLRLASILGPSRVHRLEFSLYIEAEGSHVPHKSLRCAHAVSMPVTTRAVDRLPSRLSRANDWSSVSVDVHTLSTRHQRFTCVRLHSAHLTGWSRLFRLAHHPDHWTGAASGGLSPGPATRARGASPHLLRSKAAFSWPSWLPFRAVVAHHRPRT